MHRALCALWPAGPGTAQKAATHSHENGFLVESHIRTLWRGRGLSHILIAEARCSTLARLPALAQHIVLVLLTLATERPSVTL